MTVSRQLQTAVVARLLRLLGTEAVVCRREEGKMAVLGRRLPIACASIPSMLPTVSDGAGGWLVAGGWWRWRVAQLTRGRRSP